MSQKELTHGLYRFYMMVSSKPYDIGQHMWQSIFSANMQTVYNLAMYFIWKEPRDDDPDPNYPVGMVMGLVVVI